MLRYIAWLLLAAYLLVVGLWPAAATPIGLTATGAAVVLAAIPGPVLALVAIAVYLKRRAPRPATA
jgi:hypothetical protein